MAQFQSPTGGMLLGIPDYGEQLMRALGLKGDIPSYIAPELIATLQVDDLSRGEYAWLRRTARFQVGGTVVAVAGQFGIWTFFGQNNANRNLMGIVDSLSIGNPGAAAITVSFAGVTFTGVGGVTPNRFGQNLDDRQFLNVQSAFAGGVGANAVNPTPAQACLYVVPAGGSLDIPQLPVILTNVPFTTFNPSLLVVCSAVNTAFTVAMSWRERQVLDSEL